MKNLDDAIEKYYENVSNCTNDDSEEIKNILDEMLLLNQVDIPIKFNISNMIEQVENRKVEKELQKKNAIFFIFACIFCTIMWYCSMKFAFWKVFLYEFIICMVLSSIVIVRLNKKQKTTI